jgi:hypothetical protein
MKKYSSTKTSSRFTSLLTLIVVILLAFSGLIVVNFYLNKPTQIGSKASTTYTIPAENNRQTVPSGATLLTQGTGITNGQAMNDGNFQVEGYCPRKGLGNVSRTETDWSCGTTKLQVSNYDEICQITYNNANAFVIRTGTSSTQAFNWRCHAFPAGSTITTASTTTTGGVACGEPCGAQPNGQVLPFNCANGVCGNNANGGTSGNRCLPNSAPGYVTKGGNCKNDPNTGVFCINKTDGTNVTDEAGIRAACAAAAGVTTPTPTPTATTTSSYKTCDLNKNGKCDPDDYKLFIEDYLKHI